MEKVAYGIGDFGNNFSWSFVGAFLMFFYTDVFGISASAVATLLLVTRIWDAINDPIVGALADKTNTRWGRYRPWEIFSAPFCAVLVVLTYWAHPTWGDTAKIVYMYVTYGLLVLAYTCVNLPYGTLNSVMTQNIGERAKLSSMRMVFALVAINLINGITNPLVAKLGGGDNQKGFLLVAILYACVFMVCHIICFKNVREVVTPPPKQKLPISIQLKAALKNPPFMLAVLGQTMWGLTIHGRNASLIYYFKYVEGNVAFLGLYSLISIFPKVLGSITFPYVFQKLGNKGRVASVAAAGAACGLLAMSVFRINTNPVMFFAALIFEEFFSGIFSASVYAIVPDCVEYGEWKTGIRNDGFQYAFVSLGNKIGMAVGTAGIAAAMGIMGYVANQEQSPQVISAISAFFTTIPAICWLITAVCMLFYKINKNSFANMVKETNARKTKA